MNAPVLISKRFGTQDDVAKIMGCCVRTFQRRLPDLLKDGFPAYDDVMKGYDLHAVHAYFDKRSGLTTPQSVSADAALDGWLSAR